MTTALSPESRIFTQIILSKPIQNALVATTSMGKFPIRNGFKALHAIVGAAIMQDSVATGNLVRGHIAPDNLSTTLQVHALKVQWTKLARQTQEIDAAPHRTHRKQR